MSGWPYIPLWLLPVAVRLKSSKLETGLLQNSDQKDWSDLHMEEQKSTTYRAMATYKLGVNVRTKEDAAENGISEEDVIKAAQEIAGETALLSLK